jgi:hypothetical protein
LPLFFVANRSADQLFADIPAARETGGILHQLELAEFFCESDSLDWVATNDVRRGPGGQPGCVFSVGSETQPAADPLLHDAQDWQRLSADIWICGSDGNPPRPSDLERSRFPLTTYEQRQFANGTIWQVPVIRQPLPGGKLVLPVDHDCNLPQALFRGADKRWRMAVTSGYADLWRRSQEFFSIIADGGSVQLVPAMEYALQVLTLRYRFNVLLHSRWAEEFLTTENLMDVISASVGWYVVERYVREIEHKKKAG